MSILGERSSYFASLPIQEFQRKYGDNNNSNKQGAEIEEELADSAGRIENTGTQLNSGEAHVIEGMGIDLEIPRVVGQMQGDPVSSNPIGFE